MRGNSPLRYYIPSNSETYLCHIIGKNGTIHLHTVSQQGRFRKNEALLWRHTTLLISGYNSTYTQNLGPQKLYSFMCLYVAFIMIVDGAVSLRTLNFFWTSPQISHFTWPLPVTLLRVYAHKLAINVISSKWTQWTENDCNFSSLA